MFDALAAGSAEAAEAKAGEAGCDLGRPHIFLHVERAPNGRGRRRLAGAARPGSRRGCAASTPVPSSMPATTGCGRWRPWERRATGRWPRSAALRDLAAEEGLVVGLSGVDRGATNARRRMREAADAARIGRSLVAEGGTVAYEQLGAYRYLVHLELDEAPRDRYRVAIEELSEYDRRRGSRLVETLEQYLGDRGSVTASARALFVHPNTVRQRLERIERVADLKLRTRICCRWNWR